MLMGVVFGHCCINNTDIALLYIVNVMLGRFVIGIVVGTFVGIVVGIVIGIVVGTFVGIVVGTFVGTVVGSFVGIVVTVVSIVVGTVVNPMSHQQDPPVVSLCHLCCTCHIPALSNTRRPH
jgi:hypothetical protein